MLRVNNLTGFGGIVDLPVTITDDGDSTAQTSDTGNVHTHTSETSTGPVSVLFIFWNDSTADRTLSSVTWGGVACSILVSAVFAKQGAGIAIINGAQTGDVVLTFSGAVDGTALSKASLTNLNSLTAIDTDTDSAASPGTCTLSALSSPGSNGIRLTAYINGVAGTAVTTTNATELSDTSTPGTDRISAAYDLGDDSGNIVASGGASDGTMVGVSLK